MAAGDYDGDGDLDLAVVEAESSTVALLLGNGRGGFGRPRTFRLGRNLRPQAVVAEDFNVDGRLDLAAVNRDTGDVSVLLGDGRGGLRTSGRFAVGRPPRG